MNDGSRFTFRALGALLAFSFNEFRRDRLSAFFTIVFPLFFLATFGLLSRTPEYSATIGVVPAGTGANVEAVQRMLRHGSRFVRTVVIEDAAAPAALKDGDVDAYVVVPATYRVGSGPLRTVVDRAHEDGVRLVLQAAATANDPAAKRAFATSYTLETRAATTVSLFTFVFPGLLAMALVQVGLYATATPLLRLRDSGVLMHFALTPTPPWVVFLAQLTLRFGIAAVEMTLLLGLGRALFGLDIKGSWFELIAATVLGTLMLISTGYLLAGLAKTVDSGNWIVSIVNMAFLFLGQIFFDVSHTPVLSTVIRLIPVTYLSDAFRQAVLGVSGINAISTNLLALTLWTAVLMFVASRTFRFDMAQR